MKKFQIPNLKFQLNFKSPISNFQRYDWKNRVPQSGILAAIGVWGLIGIWSLEFGV
ncbi:MAG: hypothetical protein LBK60_04610 [Verrucomicrobiales bacterium]|jgi:hypothetical protein|nr:hypothetical protein [Verrucomicrobiales bacterium]